MQLVCVMISEHEKPYREHAFSILCNRASGSPLSASAMCSELVFYRNGKWPSGDEVFLHGLFKRRSGSSLRALIISVEQSRPDAHLKSRYGRVAFSNLPAFRRQDWVAIR